MLNQRFSVLLLLFFLLSLSVYAQEGNKGPHSFEKYQFIPLYADKMWPKANPSETYDYNILPLCAPNKNQNSAQSKQDFGRNLIGLNFLLVFS